MVAERETYAHIAQSVCGLGAHRPFEKHEETVPRVLFLGCFLSLVFALDFGGQRRVTQCFFLDIRLWQMALCVCAFCFAGVSALEQPCSHCLTSVVVSLQSICIHLACVAQVIIAKVVRNASRRRFCWGRGNCRNKLSVLALHHGKAAVSW